MVVWWLDNFTKVLCNKLLYNPFNMIVVHEHSKLKPVWWASLYRWTAVASRSSRKFKLFKMLYYNKSPTTWSLNSPWSWVHECILRESWVLKPGYCESNNIFSVPIRVKREDRKTQLFYVWLVFLWCIFNFWIAFNIASSKTWDVKGTLHCLKGTVIFFGDVKVVNLMNFSQ